MRILCLLIAISGATAFTTAQALNAGAASLPVRPAQSATPAIPALSGPQRQQPPAQHMLPPYKPVGLGSAGATLQQVTVHWTVPDQSDGRVIQSWVVRACPAVQGQPYIACQPVTPPAAGQASGAMVEAQVPSHVPYMGASTAVDHAEICSANAVGTSCADRIALSFPNPALAPAPLHGLAPAAGVAAGVPIRNTVPSAGIGSAKPAARSYFLWIAGVAGESREGQHLGWIALLSASRGIAGSGANRGAGVPGPRGCQPEALSVTKLIDKASPALTRLADTGRHIDLVKLERAGVTLELHDVLISSIQQQGGGIGKPREMISFIGFPCAR